MEVWYAGIVWRFGGMEVWIESYKKKQGNKSTRHAGNGRMVGWTGVRMGGWTGSRVVQQPRVVSCGVGACSV